MKVSQKASKNDLEHWIRRAYRTIRTGVVVHRVTRTSLITLGLTSAVFLPLMGGQGDPAPTVNVVQRVAPKPDPAQVTLGDVLLEPADVDVQVLVDADGRDNSVVERHIYSAPPVTKGWHRMRWRVRSDLFVALPGNRFTLGLVEDPPAGCSYEQDREEGAARRVGNPGALCAQIEFTESRFFLNGARIKVDGTDIEVTGEHIQATSAGNRVIIEVKGAGGAEREKLGHCEIVTLDWEPLFRCHFKYLSPGTVTDNPLLEVELREQGDQDRNEVDPDVCFEMRRSERVEQQVPEREHELFAIDLKWDKVAAGNECINWESAVRDG